MVFLEKEKGKTAKSAEDERRERVNEEKPDDFEKITLEFNLMYNELLASIRDRDTRAAQEKFLVLYDLYRKISSKNLSKSQKKLLEQQLKNVAGLIPSEEPPRMLMPMLALVGIIALMFLFRPGITGLAGYEGGAMAFSYNPGISTAEVSVYSLDLEGAPASLSVSGSMTSFYDSTARIYLVDGQKYYLVARVSAERESREFERRCIETCELEGASSSGLKLLVEAHNSLLKIDSIDYTVE